MAVTSGSRRRIPIRWADIVARLRQIISRPARFFHNSPTFLLQAASRVSHRLVFSGPVAPMPSASVSQRSPGVCAAASSAHTRSARSPATPRRLTATSRRTAAEGSAASCSAAASRLPPEARTSRSPTIRRSGDLFFKSSSIASCLVPTVLVSLAFKAMPRAQARRAARRRLVAA